jgi:hypothetical protein
LVEKVVILTEAENMEKQPENIRDDDFSKLKVSLESYQSFYCIGDVITIESVVKRHEMIRNKK